MNKLQHIELHNFQGLQQVNLSAQGKHVYAIAGNAKGKSSFIRAILGILSGTDMPPEILKQGAEKGYVKMDFPDCTIELRFTEKNPKGTLLITLPDGQKVSSPRSWLNERVGIVNIDPDDFFRLRGNERNKYLYKLIGATDMVQLDADYKLAFDNRTTKNRYLEDLAKKNVGLVYDPTLIKLSDAELQAKMQQVVQHNQTVNTTQNNMARAQAESQRITGEIEQLQNQIRELEYKRQQQNAYAEQCNQWLILPQNAEIPVEDISTKMQEVATHNARVEANERTRLQLAEQEMAHQEAAKADKEVQEADQKRKTRLAQVNTIPGLEFREDGPYLNNLPLDENQQNTAELYKTFLMLSLFGMRDFRIATFDASLIDQQNEQEILRFANANDVQLLVELVDRTGGQLQLSIVDPQVF